MRGLRIARYLDLLFDQFNMISDGLKRFAIANGDVENKKPGVCLPRALTVLLR